VTLAGTPAAAIVDGAALRPVFTTCVERTVRLIRRDATVIEAVVDRGELIAEDRHAAVCELELELKAGGAAALFDLARDLAQRVPLRLSLVSKAERGYGLALGGDVAPAIRRSSAQLDPAMTVGQALQAVGRAALSQLCASAEALCDRPGPLGVHQLRVACRRMRALLRVFKPLSAGGEAQGLGRELKWLANELTAARELDVFLAEVWRPAVKTQQADETAAFGRALLAAQANAYLRMEAALESYRARLLLLDVAAWLEAGSWAADPDLAAVRDQPAPRFAAAVLEHRRHAIVKTSAHLDRLDPEVRHQLRLKGKTLRYAAEDLAGLFPHHPKRIAGFIETTKALQDALGRLNDLRVQPDLARAVALASGDPEAAFAAGRLTARGDEAALMRAAQRARDAFAEARDFWSA
jgi:inorganic triphosphatase YgiF